MIRLEKLTAVAKYLNHVAFLFYGRYMSLGDRAAGMLLVTKKEQEGKCCCALSLLQHDAEY